MGKIRKLLSIAELPAREITNRRIWSDLCENIHLHFRNLRLDMSAQEWAHFRASVHHLGMAVEHNIERADWREGDPNFLLSMFVDAELPANCDYFPNRVTIELQRDNTVHFHYRDLRIHLTVQEFKILARCFAAASMNFVTLKESPWSNITEVTHVPDAPLEDIQPYDAGHLPGVIDREHRDGIELVKRYIKEGKRIRPILVAPNGQRLDGFKRYMAHLELGKKTIEAIIDPFGVMGGQHNQSFLADSD